MIDNSSYDVFFVFGWIGGRRVSVFHLILFYDRDTGACIAVAQCHLVKSWWKIFL